MSHVALTSLASFISGKTVGIIVGITAGMSSWGCTLKIDCFNMNKRHLANAMEILGRIIVNLVLSLFDFVHISLEDWVSLLDLVKIYSLFGTYQQSIWYISTVHWYNGTYVQSIWSISIDSLVHISSPFGTCS